jgi:hypothetical protein
MRGPVTSSLAELMKAGGHLEIAPVDARLGGSHKVAQHRRKLAPTRTLILLVWRLAPLLLRALPAAKFVDCLYSGLKM